MILPVTKQYNKDYTCVHQSQLYMATYGQQHIKSDMLMA